MCGLGQSQCQLELCDNFVVLPREAVVSVGENTSEIIAKARSEGDPGTRPRGS